MSPSKRPTEKPKAPSLVDADYGAKLREAARRAGVGWETLAKKAGISPVSAWRVEKGKGSLKAALALRSALEDLGQRVEHPMIVLGRGGALQEWAELGDRLYTQNRDAFDKALDQVRSLVEAHDTIERGMSLIAHPLPRPPK